MFDEVSKLFGIEKKDSNNLYVKELLVNKKYELLKKLHKVTKDKSENDDSKPVEDLLNLKISQIDRLIKHFESKK